ncbi:MAG: inositol monophosphatase [Leptolyngbyaceae cyanobacterium SL_1_1]|nr:inositol monophosphatase [Leptolyngbyaceae cyanobacterium SL_1_1]
MGDFWQEVVEFAEGTTAKVGQQLLADFGAGFGQREVTEKADGSLVTRSDRWADGALRAAIAQTYPGHGVLSEEVAHTFPDTDWCWVIDPIDGTTNFARGVPLWGISLGLLYRGTRFGHVRIPPLQQSFYGFWYGESGLGGPAGAFLNHQPIQVSQAKPSPNQFFSLCARSTAVLKQAFPCKIRMLGVATYNLLTVAAGISLGGVEATPKIWDIAAVWAIVQAAGGQWVALETEPIFPLQPGQNYCSRAFPTLVASRPELVSVFDPYVDFLR